MVHGLATLKKLNDEAIAAAATKADVSVETIRWVDTLAELPDDGIDVLIICMSPTNPVWVAHIDGKYGWCDCDGIGIAYGVTFWAKLPEGPKAL